MKKFVLSIVMLFLAAIPSAAQPTPTPPLTARDLADPDGQFIEIDGAEIYFVERGSPEDPVVLFLHGFGGSTFTWRDTLDAVAAAGFRAIAFDRPPYGLADKRPDQDFTPQGYAQLTAGLMDSLAVEHAVLVGHSAGGAVIAQFAVDFPARVDGLVFVAGALGLREDVGAEAPQAQTDEDSESGLSGIFSLASSLDPNSPLARVAVRALLSPDRFVAILRDAYYVDSVVTTEVEQGYQRPLRVDGWEAGFLSLLTTQAEPIELEELSASVADNGLPVLLVWGQEDTWVPLSAGEALFEALPSAEFITYPEVGHMAMEENVETFNQDLVAFLLSTLAQEQ